jgi:hypothetical protein
MNFLNHYLNETYNQKELKNQLKFEVISWKFSQLQQFITLLADIKIVSFTIL